MKSVMRPLVLALLAASAGCGVTLSPRVEMPERFGDPDRGLPDRPTAPEVTPADNAMSRQICRTSATPRGWIALRYTAGDERCPPLPSGENRYTATVIHRYSNAPLGSTMTVCADQALPQGWTRLGGQEAASECPGARVREGAPTSYAMRRIR